MTLETESIELLGEALDTLELSFECLPGFDPQVDIEALRSVLAEVAVRMRDNYPYPHPMYIGHMMKPPHPVARMAYILSLWINPNNHALDGGPCSSAMEKETVAELARMFGWQTHLGHLCGGGTMANLEALWISRCLNPDKKIIASEQAHFTHNRICGVLGIPFQSISCDKAARMDLNVLESILHKEPVGTVVGTMGTTATGSRDTPPGDHSVTGPLWFQNSRGRGVRRIFHLGGQSEARKHEPLLTDCVRWILSWLIRISMDSSRMDADV